jgi:hypothetical protein
VADKQPLIFRRVRDLPFESFRMLPGPSMAGDQPPGEASLAPTPEMRARVISARVRSCRSGFSTALASGARSRYRLSQRS